MKEDNHIDKTLVEAYQAGDKKAMATLVKRWHLVFCKKAYVLIKDADLSKDIAQDCWQTIMAKLDTLENPSRFKSWSLRIVYNKSLDVLRQQSRTQLKETKIDNKQVAEVSEQKENKELKEELLKAVKLLPEQQQNILKLFYTQEYSLKEISDLLEISIGTAKSRLFHAREKLKLIFKEKKIE